LLSILYRGQKWGILVDAWNWGFERVLTQKWGFRVVQVPRGFKNRVIKVIKPTLNVKKPTFLGKKSMLDFWTEF
jgi:hypothetical protein